MYVSFHQNLIGIMNLFLQYIEHVDQNGATGNLVDILQHVETPFNLEAYEKQTNPPRGGGLAPNRPIPVLMIPPEHRQQVQLILQEFRRLEV